MSAPRVWVFQHVPFEGVGQIEPLLRDRGAEIHWLRWFEDPNACVPDPSEVDLLIVMGGPMSIHDEAEHPWLRREKEWIRAALAVGTAMLGICLGAQLIAACLGAEVTRNPEPEIGWFPIELTAAGRALWGFDRAQTTVLHWHGETFSLPVGAERLAGSAACADQGFRYRDREKGWVVGLQFHLEMRPEDVERLIAHSRDELADRPWIQGEARLRAEPEATFGHNHDLMRRLLSQLLG